MGLFSRFWGPRKSKILVVEDSPEVLALVRDVLSASGYDVTAAADGVEGLACFRKDQFDLVILDYNMPRMGGSELLQLIRLHPGGKQPVVLMLSAESMLNPIYAAYDMGIVEWIPKPFTPSTLLEKVAAHLKKTPK